MSDTNVRKGSRVRNIPEWLKADEYDKIIDRIHVPTTEPRMKRKLTGETCDYSQVKGVVDELSETFANLKVKDKAALLDELDDQMTLVELAYIRFRAKRLHATHEFPPLPKIEILQDIGIHSYEEIMASPLPRRQNVLEIL